MSELVKQSATSILELTRLIGLLTSTIQAVLPARLNRRFLQIQQISLLSENLSYLDKIVFEWKLKNLTEMVGTKLRLCNGRALIQPPVDVLIQRDASTKGWGVYGSFRRAAPFIEHLRKEKNLLWSYKRKRSNDIFIFVTRGVKLKHFE